MNTPKRLPDLHTYMVQHHLMRLGHPLRFSDGERIVAVLSSAVAPGTAGLDVDVTVLVEMPDGYRQHLEES